MSKAEIAKLGFPKEFLEDFFKRMGNGPAETLPSDYIRLIHDMWELGRKRGQPTEGIPIPPCPLAEKVMRRVGERAEAGFKKYGVTLQRTDVDQAGWMRHMQEELLDGAAYAEAWIDRQKG